MTCRQTRVTSPHKYDLYGDWSEVDSSADSGDHHLDRGKQEQTPLQPHPLQPPAFLLASLIRRAARYSYQIIMKRVTEQNLLRHRALRCAPGSNGPVAVDDEILQLNDKRPSSDILKQQAVLQADSTPL